VPASRPVVFTPISTKNPGNCDADQRHCTWREDDESRLARRTWLNVADPGIEDALIFLAVLATAPDAFSDAA